MTAHERQTLQLLGDTEMYDLAERFVARHGLLAEGRASLGGKSQLHALAQRSRREGVEELIRFARRQAQRAQAADHSGGGNADWWTALGSELDRFRQHTAVAALLSEHEFERKSEQAKYRDRLAQVLVVFFVQHLVAECLLRRALNEH